MQPHLLRHLVLVELADGIGRKFHGLAHLGSKGFFSGVKIRFSGGKLRSLHRRLVEVTGKAGQGFIAFGSNRIDDRADFCFKRSEISLGALLQLRPLLGRKRCQFVEIYFGGHEKSNSE